MAFKVGAITDIGRKRSQNQDSIASVPELGLFIVADGMGGHRGGETASAMAVDIIPQVVRHEISQGGNWLPKEVISEAILTANHHIHERAQTQQALQGMGTTAVSFLFKGKHVTIGHVGDSRAYFFRNGCLWQMTRDHSLVQEKLRAGIITRQELKTDRMKNVITRSVGFEPEVNVDVYEFDCQPGDWFMLCSDGLSGMLDDDQILEILNEAHANRQNLTDFQEAVKTLINAANANGGDDNISTVLIEFSGS